MAYKDEIVELLNNPERLIQEIPYTRGGRSSDYTMGDGYVEDGETVTATLPDFKRKIVHESTLLKELDPNSHDVLFDENLPSICVKVSDGDYREIKHKRMAIPLQRIIKNTQLIYLTNYPMQFTQMEKNPTTKQTEDFITIKQYWDLRNQDGMKNKMVDTQLSVGKVGLLYYFDRKNEIKSRILSYPKYKICSHRDKNGDIILESLYYKRGEWINGEYATIECIDSYDDTYLYRHKKTITTTANNTIVSDWVLFEQTEHGFSEIPLISKRGKVAWEGGQEAIEAYEELFNVFNAIQKRFGWGIFYIKGKFKENMKKIAGSVVLNDTDPESKGDAKFLTPPTPEGMLDTLKNLLRTIQLSTSTTFILPDDINMSGDVSGIAVQLTKELDLQNAMQKVIDWQNVADKMTRLFKEGLAKELVNKGVQPTAITDFDNVHINAKFKVWRPFNDYEYNQMIATMKGAGIISTETAIELNTLSKPDEQMRIEKEAEEAIRKAQENMLLQSENSNVGDSDNDINNDNNNDKGKEGEE